MANEDDYPFGPDDVISGSQTSYPRPTGLAPIRWWNKLWAWVSQKKLDDQHIAIYVTFRDGQTRMTVRRMAPGLLSNGLGQITDALTKSPDVKAFQISEILLSGRKTFGADMMFSAEDLARSLEGKDR